MESKNTVAAEPIVRPWEGLISEAPSEKKFMQGILGDLNYYNFNDLKTTSLELTHPIHASLPFFSCKS
jgi:hypothetical protein